MTPSSNTLVLQGASRALPKATIALFALVLILLLAIGLGIESPFLLNLAGYTCAFALFALSVNIMLGGVGEVPLGHCLFFGIGAYAPAIAIKSAGLPFEVGVLSGMAISAVAALMIGWLTLKLTGAYFSIVSWGLSAVAMVSTHNLEFAGGALGLFGFSRLAIGPFDLSVPRTYFFASAVLLLVVLALLAHVRSSRFGNALESIRQGRHLAQSLGINVFQERLKALVLSAPIAALAGSLCLPYAQIVTPETMSVLRTVDALLAVLIGGTGFLYGPVVGAVIFTIVPQFLNLDANVKVLVFSLGIIVVMMVAPGGLHQFYKAATSRLGTAGKKRS